MTNVQGWRPSASDGTRAVELFVRERRAGESAKADFVPL
jgi:hypothetical protein